MALFEKLQSLKSHRRSDGKGIKTSRTSLIIQRKGTQTVQTQLHKDDLGVVLFQPTPSFPHLFLFLSLMENYLKEVALGRVAESINNKPSVVETDPEIRAAAEAAISSSKRHWWKKRPQADIILSPRDRQILRKVKSRAWYLDKGFKCCCFQVGLDGIIGKAQTIKPMT